MNARNQNPMHSLFRSMIGEIFVTVLSVAMAVAEEGRIIAVYGDAVAKTNPPPGWSFAWNANSTIGDPTGYEPLRCTHSKSGRRIQMNYVVQDQAGQPLPNRPSHGQYGNVWAARDEQGVARYAIAAYTLQDDASGEIWVNHGNALSGGVDGTALEIYLNDTRQFSAMVEKDRVPLLFQTRLGALKKGDTVYVAVGPAESVNRVAVRLRFVIEDLPVGTQPAAPINILAPPIDAAEPQRDADGSYRTYGAKHQAQCARLVSNRSELVFIGDSITARWPAEMLEANYGKYRPTNLGIGGDWIQNVLWRIRNGVLDQAPIKAIVVLIGTNNLSNRFTPDEVAAGIARIIAALREKAPQGKILLLGILPRGESIRDATNDKVRESNAKLAALADGQTVVFLDVGPALVEPDGTIAAEVMPDRLHVAMPGFVRWLDAMKPTLDRMLTENSH